MRTNMKTVMLNLTVKITQYFKLTIEKTQQTNYRCIVQTKFHTSKIYYHSHTVLIKYRLKI